MQQQATLNDIDWATFHQNRRAKKESNFIDDFMMDVKGRGSAVSPELSWNGTDLSFTGPETKAMTDTDLWNMYVQGAQSRGLKPKVTTFEQNILPYYKQLTQAKFQEQLGRLKMMDIPQEEWNKLYRGNQEYKSHLISAIQNTANPDEVAALQGFIPANEGQGLWENIKENPMYYGAGGLMSASAAKFAYDKLATSKFKKGAKFLKGGAPYLAAMGAPMAASALGATKEEADTIGGFANVGAGSFMGYQGATGLLKDRLAGGLVNSDTLKTLRNRAKHLGIDTVDGKKLSSVKDTKAVKTAIIDKVQGQSYSKSAKALKGSSKQIFKSATGKWGNIKNVAKYGARGPGGMTMALAALTIPEIISLTKNLFGVGDEEETSKPASPYSMYQKQQYTAPSLRSWGNK